MRCSILSALSVVFSTVWFPHTVDTPISFTLGVRGRRMVFETDFETDGALKRDVLFSRS